MSVTVSAYLIDPNRLQTVYESKDTALLRDLGGQFADTLVEEERGNTPLSRRPTIPQALRAIVDGDVPPEGDGSPYGYALDIICQYIGTMLPDDEFGGISNDSIAILEGIGRLRDLADGWNPPLPIPYPSDLLGITYITAEDARTLLSSMTPIVLTLPNEPNDLWDDNTFAQWEEEWPGRMRNEYRSWLEEAAKTGSSVVMFLY